MSDLVVLSERDFKRAIRERDGNRCTQCGKTQEWHLAEYGESLHVHRLRPGKRYHSDTTITLCRPCHQKAHRLHGRRKRGRRVVSRSIVIKADPKWIRRVIHRACSLDLKPSDLVFQIVDEWMKTKPKKPRD